MRKSICILYAMFFLILNTKAQPTIGGVVNIYTPVIALACNNVTVTNPSGFSVGDRTLIIQMKGAIIDSSNTAAFGNILNYSNCGNYEFATISSIVGTTIFFQYQLLYNYTPSEKVQLIRVPQYTNTAVTSTLTAAPWNGSVGGVLVMEVSGTLTLNSNIDVSGNGFRGGAACTNPDGGCGSGYADYYYPVSSGFGAEKGEGITMISSAKNGGRGALANGGGGGNKHNTGGGGGGNYSSGGVGGNQANFCPSTPTGGIGGNGLDYTLNKIFLGGGGGCSDNNNSVGTLGTNGGGIIIIRANEIIGNSYSIIANGIDVGVIPNVIGDGAGGGGAGGTILLETPTYTGILNIVSNGGKGGDQNTTYGTCFGPGGGGGTGIIYVSTSSLPINVSSTTLPGNAGLDLYLGSPCYGASYGAAAGQIATGIKYNIVLPEDDSILATTAPLNLGNDTLICSGDSIILNAFNSGSTYLWSTGDTASTIIVTTPGIYWVSNLANNCSIPNYDTISITGPGFISLNLGNDTLICTNDSVLLNAFNSSATYLWSTGSTSSSITANAPGVYWVSVTSNICPTTLYDTINITNNPISVYLDLGSDTIVVCDDLITLDAGNPGADYIWSTGQTSSTITVTDPGIYWVNVAYSNCAVSASDTVVLIPSVTNSNPGNIPNVVTPNADNQNDFISIGSDLGPELHWIIYNRWGEKIYSGNGNMLNWNCYYNNTLLSAGTYFWILEYTPLCSATKNIKTEKGFIAVIY